jgi:predicted MFS family arabinose efflux permease
MKAKNRESAADVAGATDAPLFSAPYRNYMLIILLLIYVFNGVDRSIMWVLLEPIKNDLHLTDSELGWLSGFAFGVCYAIAGIPIGMLADRTERRRIIALAVGIWSLMTASCYFTSGFWSLFAARLAVGTAESGAPPASISLLSDLYSKRSRATVVAIYMSGSSIALILTYALGSWVAARVGWRMTFLAAGIPGVILAASVWFTFKEPQRRGDAAAAMPAPGFNVTLKYLLERAPVRWLFLGLMVSAIASVGLSTFMSSFLIRIHHVPIMRAGGAIALAHLFAAFCIPAIGRASDRLVVRDPRWAMWLPAIVVAAGVPLGLAVTLTSSLSSLYVTLPLLAAVGGSQIGPLYAFLQSHVQVRMRATTMSIAYATQNLIGIGLGALVVGIISDHLKPSYGNDALRYAMAAVSTVWLVGACCYLRAAAGLKADLLRAETSPSSRTCPIVAIK